MMAKHAKARQTLAACCVTSLYGTASEVSNLDQTATTKERMFLRVGPDRAAPPIPPTPQPHG